MCITDYDKIAARIVTLKLLSCYKMIDFFLTQWILLSQISFVIIGFDIGVPQEKDTVKIRPVSPPSQYEQIKDM